jgi:hypothetical protein
LISIPSVGIIPAWCRAALTASTYVDTGGESDESLHSNNCAMNEGRKVYDVADLAKYPFFAFHPPLSFRSSHYCHVSIRGLLMMSSHTHAPAD